MKIISGGQTGVDRAALDAAIAVGIPHGGWCPLGRLSEDGAIPSRYGLDETESPSYDVRTERNVIDSDGTVVFTRSPTPSGGTASTVAAARRHGRPVAHVLESLDPEEAARRVATFVHEHRIEVLNVAGPRESEAPHLGRYVRRVMGIFLGSISARGPGRPVAGRRHAFYTTRVPARPWWQDAVFYQIYPRSFADASGDGVGDLRGVTDHLDHLVWLGVDALWLSPFYRSPMRDFGYDVSDHTDVDPLFGTLADFDALLAAAHARGLRVIVDWVPAHTSSDHPWFVEARASRSNPKRDWYVWRDPGPNGEPPNNWTIPFPFGAPAWTRDPATGQLYLHSFLPEQPDLDWSNPAVARAMQDVLRFWLDRGVDGFRADVIHNIGKNPALRDVPPEIAAIPHCVLNDEPSTHAHLREIRRLLDSYPGGRMMVGEVYLLETARVARYYGRGDELHLSFNFPPLHAPWSAGAWRGQIATTETALGPAGAWPTWVLSNHDQPRHRTRYGSAAKARAAAVLLLSLRGTPFLYMGEELGLEDAAVPPERRVDPGGRDGCRAPMPWDDTPLHGWPADPWLPFPPGADRTNVAREREDAGSTLHLYRRLLGARRASEALRAGDLALLDPATLSESVVGWERRAGDDVRIVLVNFEAAETGVEAGHGRTIEIASDGAGEGLAFDGSLGPDQAVVLR